MNPFLLVEVLFSAKEKVLGAAAEIRTQTGSSPSGHSLIYTSQLLVSWVQISATPHFQQGLSNFRTSFLLKNDSIELLFRFYHLIEE
jgi:hypothetical protein